MTLAIRAALFCGICAVLLAATSTPAGAQRPAHPASGLAFAITLTDGGRSISTDHFPVRVPGTRGTLIVAFERWDIAGGRFSAPLTLENRTEAELRAVRVDCRPASGAAPAPLTWDILVPGARSTSLPFGAPDVSFGLETKLVTVLGAVSGVAVLAPFRVESADTAVRLDLDSRGDLLLADAAGKTIRAAADGRAASAVPARGPAGPSPSAIRKSPPDDATVVWTAKDDEVSELDRSGSVVRSFRLPGGPILDLAPGREGRLYLLRRGGAIGVLRSF